MSTDPGQTRRVQCLSTGPIKEGSPLHRALALVANEVARKLTRLTDGGDSVGTQNAGDTTESTSPLRDPAREERQR